MLPALIPFSMESSQQALGSSFAIAARQRWQALGEELQGDVTTFNSRQGDADFSDRGENEFRISNLTTGLQLVITADFDARIIRYDYEQMSEKSAGAPEGGMLSMRQSSSGAVEFYSADEQLTSEETRKILLEPLLLPPERPST